MAVLRQPRPQRRTSDDRRSRATGAKHTTHRIHLAVTAPDDELVGFTPLGLTGVKAAKLGYAIRADRWGKSYATDAARRMTTFGFEELRLHRISAAIGPDNTASIAVARNLGMQYEGRIRDHVFTDRSWRDSVLYAVLEHEWTSATSTDGLPARRSL